MVESCRIYLASELFITELQRLAFFNHHVTFLFLNCVKVSSQEELLNIFLKLHMEKEIVAMMYASKGIIYAFEILLLVTDLILPLSQSRRLSMD